MRAFATVLSEALERRELSANQFSKLAGVSQSFVSACVRGKSAPPPGWMKKWAKLLLLEGAAADAFVAAAKRHKVLTNLPPELREIQEGILAEFEAQNAATAALLGRIATLCGDHLPKDLVQEIAALQGSLKSGGESEP